VDLFAELHRAHACPPGCPHCRRVTHEETLAERYGGLVRSDTGLRLAAGFVEWELPFPLFSDDPVEDWLVREALLTRFYRQAERDVAARRAGEEGAAQRECDEQEARQRLDRFREEQGVG
jgi:hypothetical protein